MLGFGPFYNATTNIIGQCDVGTTIGNSIDINSQSNAALIEQKPKESNNVFNCGPIAPLLCTTTNHFISQCKFNDVQYTMAKYFYLDALFTSFLVVVFFIDQQIVLLHSFHMNVYGCAGDASGNQSSNIYHQVFLQ